MAIVIGHYDELGYAETRITKNPRVDFSWKFGIVSYVDDFDFHDAFPVENLVCIYVEEEKENTK